MKILIAGASGLIGTALIKQLQSKHDLVLVGRDKAKLEKQFKKQHSLLEWDELAQIHIASVQCIINLVGENIGARNWTESQKNEIIQSRVKATKTLVNHCVALGDKAPKLLNASAIGIYGLQKTIEQQNLTIYSESTTLPEPTTDFISEVGKQWEAALEPAEKADVPVIKLRFAVVLASDGGALAKMLPAFKLGLGGRVGTGKQPFSWVHIADVVQAIQFLAEDQSSCGAYNIVAPEIVTQAEFAKTLAKVLQRPCVFFMPGFMIKFLFGQMGKELLLNGQAVKAERLLAAGFQFKFSELNLALKNVLN